MMLNLTVTKGGGMATARAMATNRWIEKNREKWNEYVRGWKAKNREAELQRKAAYRAANKEKIAAYAKKKYEEGRAERERLAEQRRVEMAATLEIRLASYKQKASTKAKERWALNKDVLKKKQAREREVCTNAYVASVLNMPTNTVPMELIEAKREQILTRRIVLQIKKTFNDERKQA
jgi:hypothetical protein